jgi:hypothetical protein
VLTRNEETSSLVKKYESYGFFIFRVVTFRSYFYRLYYENFHFRNLINQFDIDLVYNFSGSRQFFLETPQLLKIHNLLFYSKKLDKFYRDSGKFFLWIRQVFLKRLVFRLMLNKSQHLEIQSKHVKHCLSDFINVRNKNFYIKSDIDVVDSSFKVPRNYDFSYKLKFLYVVGPHFEYMHKNFLDFTSAMVEINKLDIDFEINITLTKNQLAKSNIWDKSLDSKTNFHGYIDDHKKMEKLFCDNTILISTSVIETIGLHVVEAIKNGVVTITPQLSYASEVYGDFGFSYNLFDKNSLFKTIMAVVSYNKTHTNKILSQQKYLRENEMSKFKNIVAVYREILNV